MKPKRQHHAEKHIIDKRVKNTSQKKFWESRILLFHKSSILFSAAMLWFALDYSKTIQQLTGKRLLADLLWLGCILISTFIAFFVGYIQGSFASF
jgi:hypothetical protein